LSDRKLGLIAHGWSVKKISDALRRENNHNMPESTVRDNIRSLVKKHSIVPWNVHTGTAEPRRRGDHGGTTSWRLPEWEDVLAARRADPLIGTGTAKNTYFWVIGPGKRFLTQAEIAEWGLEDFVFEKYGVRAAVRGATESEFTAVDDAKGTAPAATAPKAAVSPPGASPPGTDPLPAPIKKFLKIAAPILYTPENARSLVSDTRKMATDHGYAITDAEILHLLERIWTKASKRRVQVSYFRKAMPAEFEGLIESKAEELVEQQAASPAIAARERENSVNTAQDVLRMTTDPTLKPHELLALNEMLAQTDPEILAEARKRRESA